MSSTLGGKHQSTFLHLGYNYQNSDQENGVRANLHDAVYGYGLKLRLRSLLRQMDAGAVLLFHLLY
jgi:hypothetical protein